MKAKYLNMFYYNILRFLIRTVTTYCFRPIIRRNELKHTKGPCIVLANHESYLDALLVFPYLKGPVHALINRSFHDLIPTLPKPFEKLKRTLLTPVLQFQFTIPLLRHMKEIINNGYTLLLYPSGFCSEDGIAAPITSGTWKMLKWLDADIYIARNAGAYFVLPKWTGKLRRGRTTLDIYKLTDREKLSRMTPEELGKAVTDALYYDAYRDQEKLKFRYRGCEDIRGLENVLYMCPNCRKEFTIRTEGKSTLRCSACGYAETSDEYGFLHKTGNAGEEIRHVSDWSRKIFEATKEKLLSGNEKAWSVNVTIQLFDTTSRKYQNAGRGTLAVSNSGISLSGEANGQALNIEIPPLIFPTVPFKPGKNIDIRYEDISYHCIPDNALMTVKLSHRIRFNYLRSRGIIQTEAPVT